MTDQELIDLMRGAISSVGTLNRAYLSEHFNELPGLNTLYKMVAEADARLGQSLGGNLLDKRKLAKAVDALRWYDDPSSQGDVARKVLAEIEGDVK